MQLPTMGATTILWVLTWFKDGVRRRVDCLFTLWLGALVFVAFPVAGIEVGFVELALSFSVANTEALHNKLMDVIKDKKRAANRRILVPSLHHIV
jgi:hypothetical protein